MDQLCLFNMSYLSKGDYRTQFSRLLDQNWVRREEKIDASPHTYRMVLPHSAKTTVLICGLPGPSSWSLPSTTSSFSIHTTSTCQTSPYLRAFAHAGYTAWNIVPLLFAKLTLTVLHISNTRQYFSDPSSGPYVFSFLMVLVP